MSQIERQLIIYVPTGEPYGRDNWVDQVLGEVIRPVYAQLRSAVVWMWQTRYIEQYNPQSHGEVPESHLIQIPNTDGWHYRRVAFRMRLHADQADSFEDAMTQATIASGCLPNPLGWETINTTGDLGGDRFIYLGASEEERERRGQLIAGFLSATLDLMVDSLSRGDDGKWCREPNQDGNNSAGNLFQSVHHLFCNATDVPTFVGMADNYELKWIQVRF